MLVEAGSILSAYQPLLAAAFVPGVLLPVPMLAVGPPPPLSFHHAEMAAHAVVQRIGNPGECLGCFVYFLIHPCLARSQFS